MKLILLTDTAELVIDHTMLTQNMFGDILVTINEQIHKLKDLEIMDDFLDS